MRTLSVPVAGGAVSISGMEVEVGCFTEKPMGIVGSCSYGIGRLCVVHVVISGTHVGISVHLRGYLSQPPLLKRAAEPQVVPVSLSQGFLWLIYACFIQLYKTWCSCA